jgi:uncharacterized UPF0160 family protein
MNIKGRIEGVNQKDKGYGVLVAGNWYNAYGECPVEKNDFVTIDYADKGRFHNITKIEKIEIPEEKIVPVLKATYEEIRTDDIHFQVCLKIASEQIAAMGGTDKMTFIVARARELMKEAWG